METDNNQLAFSVWEGVFDDFADAQGDLDAFESDIWIEKQKSKSLEYLSRYKTQDFCDKEYTLSIFIATLLAFFDRLEILDFGGGMGLNYLELISKIPVAGGVGYHIVDNNIVIQNKPTEFEGFENLYYYDDLKKVDGLMDVCHIGSTLQYIDNWEGLLSNINEKFKPKYFVFSDLLTGDVPTFVSHQKFYGKRVPCRFFNLKEVIDYCHNLGFEMLYKSKFISKILNQTDVFPNNGLPKEYRIDRASNLIFKKV